MTGVVGFTLIVIQLFPVVQLQLVAQTVYAPTCVPAGMVKVRTELVPLPGEPGHGTITLLELRTTQLTQLFNALLGKLTVTFVLASAQVLEAVSVG